MIPALRKSLVAISTAFSYVPAPVFAYTCALNIICLYLSSDILSIAFSAVPKSFFVAFIRASSFLVLSLKKAPSAPCDTLDAFKPFFKALNIFCSCSVPPSCLAANIIASIESFMLLNDFVNFFLFCALYFSRALSCSTCHCDQLNPISVSSALWLARLRIIEAISSSSMALNAFSIS